MAAMPPPEPIGLYVIFVPVAWSYPGIHFEISGNGNVAPAPTSVSPLALAGAVCFAVAAVTTASDASSVARRATPLFSMLSTPLGIPDSLPEGWGRDGFVWAETSFRSGDGPVNRPDSTRLPELPPGPCEERAR